MNEALFIRRNKRDWDRLEAYATRLDRRAERLSAMDLFSFIALYRKVTSDLARARMLKLSRPLVDYLNGLVGKVHFRVYAARAFPARRVLDFFRSGFPRAVRREARLIVAAAALLVGTALAAGIAVSVNPLLGPAFAPPGYLEQVEESFGPTFGKEARPTGMQAVAGSFYIANNIQVSFLCFATGILFGLGTMYILAVNGAILGGVAAAIHQNGLSWNFWSFVAPHGGLELAAIVISGAAGIRIGFALVNPGRMTRKDALVSAAREAGLLMFGVIAMLVVAAWVEAVLSPSPLPNAVKLALGAVNLGALLSYLALAGREPVDAARGGAGR